jgi:hypothetical protein
MAASLANTLNFLAQQAGMQQRQIPPASQEFMNSRPSPYNQAPGNRQEYTHPALAAVYQAPASLAAFLQSQNPLNAGPGVVERRNALMASQIANQTGNNQ